jgi:septal ring factor EnvC (AmiA/AmiB activator)
MSDNVQDLTLQVLRQIRDEVGKTNTRLDGISERLELTNERLELTNERLGHVETTLQDLATQQAFVSKFVRTLAARDRDLADDVDELRDRVTALERRTG